MKDKLIEYLKTKSINDVHCLWGEAKHYYNSRLIAMGGCYSSGGDHIIVRLNANGKNERFKVSLTEVKATEESSLKCRLL